MKKGGSVNSVTGVIAAAGSGERLGAGGPKAFVEVAGRPLIEWSLEAMRAAESVAAIVVAAPPGKEGQLGDVEAVSGGATRAESVAAALAVVDTEIVAIHDAARPLVTPELVDALVMRLEGAVGAVAVIAAAPLTDTVKRANGEGESLETLDRSELWGAQTPQVFRVAALREAIAVHGGDAATDEAMLVEAAGGTVLLHDPGTPNFKITTAADLTLAEALLSLRR